MNDLTSISVALISLVGTGLTVAIVWFLNEKVGETRIKKANEILKKVNNEFIMKQAWVMEAVRYAEQVLKEKTGTQKYDAVMQFVSSKAKNVGIDLSPDELNILIESQLHKVRTGVSDELTRITTSKPVTIADESIIRAVNNDSAFYVDSNDVYNSNNLKK